VDWINIAWDRNPWRPLVNAVYGPSDTIKRREIWVTRQYQLLEFTFHDVNWFQSSTQGSMIIRRKVKLGFCVKSEEWFQSWKCCIWTDLFTTSFEKSYNTNEVSPNLSFNPFKYTVHLTNSFKFWSLPTKQASNQPNNGTHSIWISWGFFAKKSLEFYEYAGSLTSSEKPATCPYPQPHHFLKIRFDIILPSTPRSSNVSLLIRQRQNV